MPSCLHIRVVGAKALGPSSAAFPGTLPRSWIETGEATGQLCYITGKVNAYDTSISYGCQFMFAISLPC